MKFSITLALPDSEESASMAESIQNSRNYYLQNTVKDGKELLSVLSDSETDLVILDNTLPTCDTLSILSFARNLIRRPIFAVLCTYPVRNDQLYLSDAGSDLIFYKPVLCEALLRSCLPYCIRNSWEKEFPNHRQMYTYSRMNPETPRSSIGITAPYYAGFDRSAFLYPSEPSQAVAESLYGYGTSHSFPFYPEMIPDENMRLSDPVSLRSDSIASAEDGFPAASHLNKDSFSKAPAKPQLKPSSASAISSREEIIENFLRSLGFPATRKGFLYLQYALEYLLDHNNQSPCGKTIYRQIVSRVDEDTKETAVERAIRNSIDKTWESGDLSVLNQYFPQEKMPRNSRRRTNSQHRKAEKTEYTQSGTTVLCPTNIYFMVECAKHIRKRLSGTPSLHPDSTTAVSSVTTGNGSSS